MPGTQTAVKKRARIDSWRGVPLVVDDIAATTLGFAAEEMVEADLQQGGERGVGGDVSAYAGVFAIGAHHHCQSIPANQAFDAPLDLPIARIFRLQAARNGIDVRCVACELQR